MITLLSECHFWTTHDEIRIKPTDFGAFKYSTKRDPDVRALAAQGKREYAEKRDGTVVVSNRRPSRLKESLSRLEELLKASKVVRCEWRDAAVVQLMFANGILVHVCLNANTGDVEKMAFDKYFVGKLASETVTDAVFTRQHIVLAYNLNQITVVFLQKPNMRRSGPEKIANMDPKIFHVLIPGPSERKLPRSLLVNSSCDLIVVWTKSSLNEVYPWRPTIRDQDRANVHVFKLRSAKLESVAFCWTENDPICMEFIRASDGQVMTVEQKVSRKGEITAEICSYEIGLAKMQRVAVTSIPIGTQICCHGFSPDQEKLVLGTIDRYVCVHDLVQKTTKFAPKTDIIPTHCAWHPDSGVFMISNDRCQFQCLDLSLSFVANQIISEDVTPSNLHDLSHYFAIQPTLLKTSFSCKPDLNNFNETYAQIDCFLLMIYENGPIGCMRFLSGTGMGGDVHNSGLTPDVLVNKYLAISQMERAVNVLLSLNWDTYGAMCLIALHKIACFVFTRNDAKRSRNEMLRRALQSFTDDLNDETKDEFGDQVIDLKRRYFVFLLRHRLYNEAFDLARNIEDYDLFMDLHYITKSDAKLLPLATEAYRQAESVLNQNDSTTGTSNITQGDSHSITSCSHSSCSECVQANQQTFKGDPKGRSNSHNPHTHTLKSTASMSGPTQSLIVKRFQKNRLQQQQQQQPQPEIDSHSSSNYTKNYVPPLPYLKSKVFNAENIKINIPKPELRIGQGSGLIGIADKVQGHYVKPQQNVKMPAPLPLSLADAKRSGHHYRVGNGMERHQPVASESLAEPVHLNTINSNFRNSIACSDQNLYNSGEGYTMDRGISYTPAQQTNRLWSNVPDQTLGIPLAGNTTNATSLYSSKPPLSSLMSTSSYGMLPRASTAFSNSFLHLPSNPHQHSQSLSNNNNSFQLVKSESLHNLPKFYQHPLVSGKIPSALPAFASLLQSTDDLMLRAMRKPAISILSNSSSNATGGVTNGNSVAVTSGSNSNLTSQNRKDVGEKNKVKFSDTVQVAVVPEIPRKEKPLPTKRNGFHPRMTDPQKELADSLPLCHPNDDYLKDFNPATTETTGNNSTESAITESEQNNGRSAPTIKVVHFGVV